MYQYIQVYTGLLFVYFDILVYGLYIHVYLMHHFWQIMSAFSMARVPSTSLSWRKTRGYNFSTSCWPTFSRSCQEATVWRPSPSPRPSATPSLHSSKGLCLPSRQRTTCLHPSFLPGQSRTSTASSSTRCLLFIPKVSIGVPFVLNPWLSRNLNPCRSSIFTRSCVWS